MPPFSIPLSIFSISGRLVAPGVLAVFLPAPGNVIPLTNIESGGRRLAILCHAGLIKSKKIAKTGPINIPMLTPIRLNALASIRVSVLNLWPNLYCAYAVIRPCIIRGITKMLLTIGGKAKRDTCTIRRRSTNGNKITAAPTATPHIASLVLTTSNNPNLANIASVGLVCIIPLNTNTNKVTPAIPTIIKPIEEPNDATNSAMPIAPIAPYLNEFIDLCKLLTGGLRPFLNLSTLPITFILIIMPSAIRAIIPINAATLIAVATPPTTAGRRIAASKPTTVAIIPPVTIIFSII